MPIPSKVTTERATALREEAQRIGRSVRGLAKVFEPLTP
jgi:hypothetical protein